MTHPDHVYKLAPAEHAALTPLADVVSDWSDSRAGLAQRCGFAFFLRYVCGWRERPVGVVLGRAYDAMCNGSLTEKLVHGSDPVWGEAADRFALAFRSELAEARDGVEEYDAAEHLRDGLHLTKLWVREMAPRITPRSVQAAIRTEVTAPDGETFAVRGYIDAVAHVDDAKDPCVVDHKTTRRSWSEGQALDGTQPAIYVQGARREWPTVHSVQYHVAVALKKAPKLQIITREVPQAEIAGVFRRIAAVRSSTLAAGLAGAWVPNRHHYLCSRRWCGYWRHCEKVWGPAVKP